MLRAVLTGFMQMTGGFKHTLVKKFKKGQNVYGK